MKMQTNYEKKESYLRELKAELKEAEAEIIRIRNDVEMKFGERNAELNEILDNLNRKANEVEIHIKELEKSAKDEYEDKLELVTKSWNGLVAMLNKAELSIREHEDTGNSA